MGNLFDSKSELPLGLSMALAQNPDALNKFANLPQSSRSAFVQGAHQVGSKQEMQAYVDKLLQS